MRDCASKIMFGLSRSFRQMLFGAIFAVLLSALMTASSLALVVKNVQFQESAATTRVVLNLDAPAGKLTVNDRPGKSMIVAFNGRLAQKTVNRNFNHPNLSGVYVEARNGRVQMFIKRSYLGTVTVRQENRRVVVSVPNNKPQPKAPDAKPVPPDTASKPDAAVAALAVTAPASQVAQNQGMRHYRFTQSTGGGPAIVNVLEIDPKDPGIEVLPALAANRMGAKENVAHIVASNQAVAGVNGSFFKQDKGIPLGLMIIDQELVSGPIYDRVALGITPTNELVMERVRLAGEVTMEGGGSSLPIHNINQPRVLPTQTVAYTIRWGKSAPGVPKDGMQIQLRNSRVTAVSTTDSLPIPSDGVVISGPATPAMMALAKLQGATAPAELSIYTFPDWSGMKHAIGGGPYLVKNGRQYVDARVQHFYGKSLGFREPRTAVGILPDGKMLLVTVDGRRKGVSAGMTLAEMSYLMRKLGCVQAMNLDGGSSTQMALNGMTVNRPSSGPVGVSNSLIVRRTGDGNVALNGSGR